MNGKPTTEDLGIDPDALDWQHSGAGNLGGNGTIEIAFVRAGGAGGADGAGGGVAQAAADWVLMRVAGDPDRRVLVFDRNEWECFLDGARNGEFDDAAGDAAT
jgi:hypothetical protein